MAVVCAQCGAKQGLAALLTADLGGAPYYCDSCARAREQDRQAADRAAEQERRAREADIRQRAKSVIVTTTPKVDGFYVVKYLGIESVEFVIGTGVFSEITSSIQDFFGTRSSAFEQKLQAAKKHALGALKYLAAEKGANAVVGVDLDYAEFSGNRIALIINGTLVQLAPVTSTRS